MKILALDTATKTRWAIFDSAAGKIIESGVQDFAKRRGESNPNLQEGNTCVCQRKEANNVRDYI